MKPRVKLRGTADYGELKLTSVPSDGNKRHCEERLCIWLPGIHVDVLTPLAASRATPCPDPLEYRVFKRSESYNGVTCNSILACQLQLLTGSLFVIRTNITPQKKIQLPDESTVELILGF